MDQHQPADGTTHRGETSIGDLLARYDAIFLDAYGVLIHQHGALPGALSLIGTMNAMEKSYFVLTNDASRSPETAARRFHRLGLDIPPGRIITSGALIAPYFTEHHLAERRCAVLGPEDSFRYVSEAGGVIVPIHDDGEAEVFIICDETGFPFLETVNAMLTMVFRAIDAGSDVHLLVSNPDLVFPRGERSWGLTAGSIALVLEEALSLRYAGRERLRFVPLGKPHAPIFSEAVRRAGTRNAVMIGDQLPTDIRGATEFGLDSALVPTGLTHLGGGSLGDVVPTYVLPSLIMGR